MKKIALVLLTLLTATTAFAGELFLPVVFRGPGALGSQWQTEIAVSNITQDPLLETVVVTMRLYRPGVDEASVNIVLSRYEVYDVRDVLYDWFNVTEGSGLLRMEWSEPTGRIAARARIYNVTENGEFGQGFPAVTREGLAAKQYLVGLGGINGNRSNVGVANPGETDALIWIGLHDTSGLERGSFATIIPARSTKQFNDIFAYFQAGALDTAMVYVLSNSTPVYAYGSVIRNDTGDPTFVGPSQ